MRSIWRHNSRLPLATFPEASTSPSRCRRSRTCRGSTSPRCRACRASRPDRSDLRVCSGPSPDRIALRCPRERRGRDRAWPARSPTHREHARRSAASRSRSGLRTSCDRSSRSSSRAISSHNGPSHSGQDRSVSSIMHSLLPDRTPRPHGRADSRSGVSGLNRGRGSARDREQPVPKPRRNDVAQPVLPKMNLVLAGPGDRPGADIVDVLLAGLAGLARGQGPHREAAFAATNQAGQQILEDDAGRDGGDLFGGPVRCGPSPASMVLAPRPPQRGHRLPHLPRHEGLAEVRHPHHVLLGVAPDHAGVVDDARGMLLPEQLAVIDRVAQPVADRIRVEWLVFVGDIGIGVERPGQPRAPPAGVVAPAGRAPG